MKISHLKTGTKLMWDAPPNNSINPNKRITYPAIVGEKHYDFPMVKIITGNKGNWMGPEEEYLRFPSNVELETLTWPELK
ncbi:hypothetical protein [Chitinophaga niabensis]|uniref:Uncharacterized protein n=1 Tax=Chitinophaga niabensis TaxID=536979 RepID=A0A1N6KBX6_9BACT|nr:hypothetical protein [Chitinophaga niabensis]SIO53953.1 hypothetical protein SAMN04488055_5511 [Chitinophaga niabensis]